MLMAPAKPPPDPDLARRVRAAIAYARLDQKKVSQALGIKDSQLRRYLSGQVAFKESQLRTIAQMCNVSLRLLYEAFPPYPPGELGHALQDSPANGPRPDQTPTSEEEDEPRGTDEA